MTKLDLITSICKQQKTLSKKLVNEVLESCFHALAQGVKKSKRFTYPGFGTWTVKNRKARKGINPQTGQSISIKASKTITFKPSSDLKKSLNK